MSTNVKGVKKSEIVKLNLLVVNERTISNVEDGEFGTIANDERGFNCDVANYAIGSYHNRFQSM